MENAQKTLQTIYSLAFCLSTQKFAFRHVHKHSMYTTLVFRLKVKENELGVGLVFPSPHEVDLKPPKPTCHSLRDFSSAPTMVRVIVDTFVLPTFLFQGSG